MPAALIWGSIIGAGCAWWFGFPPMGAALFAYVTGIGVGMAWKDEAP